MNNNKKRIISIGLPDQNNSFYLYNQNWVYDINKLIIFVFGSNTAGRHGASAAKYAMLNHHAVYGIGKGIQGGSYAVPTKDKNIKTLPLTDIKKHVDDFLQFIDDHPNIYFFVTAVGTGLAGYKDSEIAPMFKGAKRCWFPKSWEKYLKEDNKNE